MAPGGITTTSKYSPAATRRARAPAVSFSIVTLWPVFFSNSGTSSSATDLKAPAVRSFRSAAEAPPRPQQEADDEQGEKRAGDQSCAWSP